MPELPEIETISRNLRELLPGRRIVGVQILERRLRIPVTCEFSSSLISRQIQDVGRRGKYLLVSLEGEQVWVVHLGMSGKLIYLDQPSAKDPHDHLIVILEGSGELRYHDPRRFGLSLVLPRSELLSWPPLRDLGPDPFDPCFNGAYLASGGRRSRRKVRDFLLDQRVVAGLGNIYVNEILHCAGIQPAVRSLRLARHRWDRVAELTSRVLESAIRWRGTSFSDYRDAQNRRGEFQNHLKVYDREGKPCISCGSRIKRVVIGNRSAFYCPSCQSR